MDLSQTHTTSEGKRLRQSNARAHAGIVGVRIAANVPGTVREDDSSYGRLEQFHTTTRALAGHSACEGHCRSVSYDNRRPGRQRDVVQTWSDRANPAA